MNMLRALAAGLFVLCALQIAEGGTLFTNPVLVVRPMTVDFGRVATNAVATKTFLVENIGSGKVVGAATVAAPFKILSGGEYTLRANDVQVVTLTYTPTGAASDTQTVEFTGGAGVKATVIGKPDLSALKKPKRR
jgi:hypothetical protein